MPAGPTYSSKTTCFSVVIAIALMLQACGADEPGTSQATPDSAIDAMGDNAIPDGQQDGVVTTCTDLDGDGYAASTVTMGRITFMRVPLSSATSSTITATALSTKSAPAKMVARGFVTMALLGQSGSDVARLAFSSARVACLATAKSSALHETNCAMAATTTAMAKPTKD